jgi:SAM-dependent methyltransferase
MWQGRLRAHPHLEDRESRLCELVEYLGWDVAQKARYCTPWFFEDDPRFTAYYRQLGLELQQFRLMHQVSLFNRMDPERRDLFWIYDGLLSRLEALGGPGRVSVLDFGCGPGLIGLAFACAGYRTVCSEVAPDYCDFQRFMASIRDVELVVSLAETERSYYDTAVDGHPFGLVVEWSAFEHVPDVLVALEQVTAGLMPGGLFLTTTFCKDWTPALIEHYRRDAPEPAIAEQLLSPQTDDWLRERFEVLSPPQSIAKVLVRR